MIDLIDIDADHVLGVRVRENVLSTDVDLAMGFLEKKVRTRDHIALYAEIDDVSEVDSGVIMKELRFSPTQLKSFRHIERAAVVTDNEWVRDNEAIVDLIPTVEVKTYSKAEKEAAKTWVSQPLPV